MNNGKMQNDMMLGDKKPKKINTIIIGVITSIFIIALGIGVFMYFNTNSKLILSKSITKLYDNFLNSNNTNNVVSKILQNNNVEVDSNVDIKIKDSTDSLSGIENINFDYKYIEDKENEKGSLFIDSKINNEDFIYLESLMKDNKVYYKIKDIMDTYYYSNYEFISMLNDNSTEDMKYVLDIVKNSIIKSIDDKDLEKSDTQIKIDNKDTKVKKVSLKITTDLVKKIINNSIDNIKNDNKAMDILSKVLEKYKGEVTTYLDSIVSTSSQIDNSDLKDEVIVYNMYVKGLNTTVKHEFVIENFKMQYYDYEDVHEISMSSEGIKILSLKFEGNESGKISGSMLLSIAVNGEYSKDGIKLNLKSIDNSTEIDLDIKNNSKDTNNDEEYNFDTTVKMSIKEQQEEIINVEVTNKGTLRSGKKVEDIDVSDSKNIDEVSEEELNELQEKIQNIPIIKSIMEKANTIMENNALDDNFDYNYETYSF